MKVMQINTFPYKATGNIMFQIHNVLKNNDVTSYVVWGRGRDPHGSDEFSIKDNFGMKIHGFYTRIFDKTGFASTRATKKLIQIINNTKPDIIHLHNIHGYYLNIELLFEYLRKKPQINIVWTIHDCWPITGHCAYFEAIGCPKWKTGCDKCIQSYTYPKSLFWDNSKWNWQKKKELFTGQNMNLVTPSFWLKSVLKESFLSDYPIHVIYNGIDLETFQKKIVKKRKYILGVASEWTERKGLKDFVALRSILDKSYEIILVGLTKKQIKKLPKGIIGMERTSNVDELVKLYSEAMVFVNLSVEETMGMTTVEAIACGTPVVVYNSTAIPEVVTPKSGVVVNKIHDISEVVSAIYKIEKGNYADCNLEVFKFEKNKQFFMYLDLYKELVK